MILGNYQHLSKKHTKKYFTMKPKKTIKSPALLNEIALIFQSLSDVTRLQIIQCLQESEMCVGHLSQALQVGQPSISKHLQILSRAHLVTFKKEGTTVYYSLSNKKIGRICESVCQCYKDVLNQKMKCLE